MFTESWGWWAHEAPFHLPVFMSGKCTEVLLRLEISKHFSDTYKSFSWEMGWGVLTVASTVGRWKEADPGIPLSLVVSGVGSCPTPSGPAGRLESSCMVCLSEHSPGNLEYVAPWD